MEAASHAFLRGYSGQLEKATEKILKRDRENDRNRKKVFSYF